GMAIPIIGYFAYGRESQPENPRLYLGFQSATLLYYPINIVQNDYSNCLQPPVLLNHPQSRQPIPKRYLAYRIYPSRWAPFSRQVVSYSVRSHPTMRFY